MPLAGIVIPPMVALAVYMLLIAFAVVVYNVTQVSFRQRLCPRPLLGRMNASIRFIVWGMMPLGSLVGGILGEALGVRNVFWIALVGSARGRAAGAVLTPRLHAGPAQGDRPAQLSARSSARRRAPGRRTPPR